MSKHSATLPLTVYLPTTNNRIPHAVNISVSRSWWWTKYCPEHVELILYINKSLLHLAASSILLYLTIYYYQLDALIIIYS